MPQQIRPGKWLYGLAALVALLSIVGFIWILLSRIKETETSLPQFIMPGSGELSLTQPGTYSIFYEPTTVVGNRVFSTEEKLPGIKCTVASAAGGNLELSQPEMLETYILKGRSGKSVLEFTALNPGEFQFTCAYQDDAKQPEVVFAVGHDIIIDGFKTVALCFASLFGGIGLGTLIFAITFVRRREAASRFEQSGAFPPTDTLTRN